MTSDCRHCETEMAKRSPQLDSLGSGKDAFVHPGGYFSCELFRCPRCEARWADVYHEWDDEDTSLSEWGHVERFWRRLSAEQYEAIVAARGRLSLDYRHFFSYGPQGDGAAAPSPQESLEERIESLDAKEEGAALLDGIADAGDVRASYEEVLVARRALADDLGTPEAHLSLARTLLAVARSREATGDPSAACEALEDCIRVATGVHPADDATGSFEITMEAHSLAAAVHHANGNHAAALLAADEGKRLGEELLDNGGGLECLLAAVECMSIRSSCLLSLDRLDEAHETIHLGEVSAMELEECGEEEPAVLAACVLYWRVRAAVARKCEEETDAAAAEARAALIEERLEG